MSRLLVFCAAASVLTAVNARAAEVTRVASSFEDKDPFGMYLDFTFDRLQEKGRIVREWYQLGSTQDVTELNYAHAQTSLGLDLHLGIFRDLEIHVGVPIIFQDDRSWSFAKDTTPDNTTIYRNCPDARGNLCSNPGQGTNRLFEVNDSTASYRAGLGDFVFGLAWAPYVQKKDPSKPTWVLRFDYTAPTAALLDPSIATTSSSRGAVGEKIHKYTFETSVSKRLWFAEPYFVLNYTLPWRSGLTASNCDHPNATSMGYVENCGVNWSHDDTALRPVHTGSVTFGTELTAFERPEHHQRVAFDLRGWMRYFSEGRVYNEMSDLFGKFLYQGDYGQVGGQIGFVGQAAEFVILRASASLAYNTEHFITMENIGKDLDGNGTVDITANPAEINPNYDFRVDRVGRRFRIDEQYLFRLQVTATFNF